MAIKPAASKPDETTSLLPQSPIQTIKYGKSVLYRALLCAFAVSLSFGVTQVPLIYVFRLMTCEEYYKNHLDTSLPGQDRCGITDIEADTARAVALLGASTTLFGVLNLFVTGWAIKRFGIKAALLLSVFWPAVRLAIQNVGVKVGGLSGILIIQLSQIITIIGGPAGYLLALNSYVTEIIDQKERTGALGRLQGCSFFGLAIAYMMGGLLSDHFGILAPFQVATTLFVLCNIYVMLFLPWLPPNTAAPGTPAPKGISNFLGPLKMFTPQKWVLASGKIQFEYGVLLLGIGVFLGVLATGYQSVLLQMYATDVFGFSTSKNGYLISLNTFIQGLFLTLIFPRTISAGRAYLMPTENKNIASNFSESTVPSLPTDSTDFASVPARDSVEEPIEPPKPTDEKETFAFDLYYCRYSLLADGLLTGAAALVTQGWQMYVIAAVLPFASGTGASAKGSILQMCPAGQRADALSAITLVEMLARLSTTSVFGLVFAAFAQAGMTHLVFVCNAAVAIVGFGVLLFCRFPPEKSKRFDEAESAEST